MTAGRRLGDLLAETKDRLTSAGLADAVIESRILIGGLLGLSGTEVFTGGDRTVTATDQKRIEVAVERRLRREPVHRILGQRDFYGLDLKLSRETLEPRPDTEILVDRVLPHLRRLAARSGAARILDLGTGTGAICLALLKECPQAHGTGTDVSEDALATARLNAHLNGLADRFETRRSDWFAAIDGLFDVIVSNPPYIASTVVTTLEPEVRDYDPIAALDGGEDGLVAYRAIAAEAGPFLARDGILAVEIGHDQRHAVSALFAAKTFELDEAARDYGGNDRVLLFRGNNVQ